MSKARAAKESAASSDAATGDVEMKSESGRKPAPAKRKNNSSNKPDPFTIAANL